MPYEHHAGAPKYLYIAALVAAAAVLILGWYATSKPAPANPAAAAQEVNTAIVRSQAASQVSVPATANPVKQATPAVNPVEATNPFNDTSTNSPDNGYQNPF